MNYKKVFFLGFGFLGVMLAWTFYNSFVPVLLKKIIASNAIIGFIMTFDNLLGVTVQPLIGALSDRTRTPIGRRLPYLIIGAPLAAIFFSYIPLASSLMIMIIVIICMNLSMALFRSPMIALMPDIYPANQRSKANGIINFMGGVGAIIALSIGGRLFDKNLKFSFLLISSLMFIAVMAVFVMIKEPDLAAGKKRKSSAKNEDNLISARLVRMSFISILASGVTYCLLTDVIFNKNLLHIKINFGIEGRILLSLSVFALIMFFSVLKKMKKTSILLFISIFFWFFGYNGIETFFTLFGTKRLGITAGKASLLLGLFSLSFILFAIPVGIFSEKLGRHRFVLGGLILLLCLTPLVGLSAKIIPIGILMFICGAAWAAINVNAYPLICDMANIKTLGTFTGLYYFFSMFAQTISPPIFGMVIDKTNNYSSVFFVASLFFCLALLTFSIAFKDYKKEKS